MHPICMHPNPHHPLTSHPYNPPIAADYVYVELKVRTCDAILELVARERDGEIVDRALIKNVLDIYIEVGMGNMDMYERDFEARLLEQTRLYCAQQAASWFAEDSCPEYMIKAEASLTSEEERVDKYLHASTKPKLLGVVEEELLARYERQLIEKEASGCAALLRDDKVCGSCGCLMAGFATSVCVLHAVGVGVCCGDPYQALASVCTPSRCCTQSLSILLPCLFPLHSCHSPLYVFSFF